MGERLTVLLSLMQSGEQAARDAVFAVLYPEPQRLAHSRLLAGRKLPKRDLTLPSTRSWDRLGCPGDHDKVRRTK